MNLVKREKNLVKKQREMLFNREYLPSSEPIFTYGIPRVLNMYEEFPFWCTLLTSLGFKVELSSSSNFALYEMGLKYVMSENVCVPAKIVHSHILNLIQRGVDRIFLSNSGL